MQGLQSAASKLTKPNDLFVECHMGDLDPGVMLFELLLLFEGFLFKVFRCFFFFF